MSVQVFEQILKLAVTTTITPTLPDPDILAGQLALSSIRMYRRDIAAHVAWCAGQGLSADDASSLGR